eukprot:scaffold5793_cov417-Prasinococcus_capsulatus_cf.AAC.5
MPRSVQPRERVGGQTGRFLLGGIVVVGRVHIQVRVTRATENARPSHPTEDGNQDDERRKRHRYAKTESWRPVPRTSRIEKASARWSAKTAR